MKLPRFWRCVSPALTLLIGLWNSSLFAAGDWPTFGGDNLRSAVANTELDTPLEQSWVHRAAHRPSPAWPPPAKFDYWHYKKDLNPRVTYDHAFHTAVVGGRVFYGSSTDDQVVCLDARTGSILWTFSTEGPVRLAPTVAHGKLFVGSDDGTVYCLATANGALIWRSLIGPADSRCIGNGRMISRWPVRSSVLVQDKVAYCAAGIFPTSEGVVLKAIHTETGEQVLHERVEQSVQGYMALSRDQLLLPSGRTSPGVFDRKTGKRVGEIAGPGGVYTFVSDDVLVAGQGDTSGELSVVEPDTRQQVISLQGLHLIAHKDNFFVHGREELAALDRKRFLPLARRQAKLKGRMSDLEKRKDTEANEERQKIKAEMGRLNVSMKACWLWRTPCENSESLILVGDKLFAGGNKSVTGYKTSDGSEVWNGHVDGRACGLAAAQGQLFVSTDRGSIFCFKQDHTQTTQPGTGAQSSMLPADGRAPQQVPEKYARMAAEILDNNAADRGYCLLIGARDGYLARAVAGQSQLRVIVAESDKKRAAAAREYLRANGVYGSRAVVHQVEYDKLPYPPYFANLVIVRPETLSGSPTLIRQIRRVVRPSGGIAWFGGFADAEAANITRPLINMDSEAFRIGWTRAASQSWIVARRAPLDGAGEWTHGFADPANTACSMDQRVRGKVRIQWYGRPGPRLMADRHHRNVPPLYKQGRLFIPGENLVIAVDAYNGTQLWKRDIAKSLRLGTFLDCSNMAVDDQSLYVAAEDTCHVLDVATGDVRKQIAVPQLITGQHRHWGYLARVADQLVGSGRRPQASYHRQSREHDNALWYDNMSMVTSDYLFALSPTSGATGWTYKSGTILNTTITIGGGRVYFLESHSPKALEEESGRMPMATFLHGPNYLVALDLHTGHVAWKRDFDLADCRLIAYINYAKEKLVVSGNKYVDKRLWYYFYGLDADTGKDSWRTHHNSGYSPDGGHGEQNRHPTIIDDVVYTYPYAYQLHTGEQVKGWKFDRIGHGCGNISASAGSIYWRGGNPWGRDLEAGKRPNQINTVNRPGCFINILPAGGLLLIPEASSGCTCGFPLQTSLAYVPEEALD